MRLYRYLHRGMVLGLVVAAMCATAQSSVAISEPGAPLLPTSFGEWKTAQGSGSVPEYSLANASKAALEECGPQRSAVGDYERGGKTVHIEAIQFGDRTGAYSAFTLMAKPGMKVGKELGSADAVGNGVVLFTDGDSLVLVNGTTETSPLKPLAAGLPKVSGSKGLAPLLPTLVPAKGLVAGSIRYALGASTYAAEGGVLPAQSLGWEKSAEAVTAQYDDRRGKETLTLLMYPTPTIAGDFHKQILEYTANPPVSAGAVRSRREGELVLLAEGSFSPDEAQRMIENIHLKQELSFDRDMPPVFHVEVQKTYSLLTNLAVLTGVLMAAAVLLGLFLGAGGRWCAC
ncbi:hypothetical protein GOB94_04145 [Granulicella sp. 5B5]|uniref:DUF6599 family protein n=1 Tax=Granulicella sp. 5B5 TaxID=1617967 RepID=UPI0015F5E895|nr:DUF6599 family protein [Granulicella sp. 5B5]QMV17970.1 hypothetical protein GOB94_04145 [Granulicella sp. 5B5]